MLFVKSWLVHSSQQQYTILVPGLAQQYRTDRSVKPGTNRQNRQGVLRAAVDWLDLLWNCLSVCSIEYTHPRCIHTHIYRKAFTIATLPRSRNPSWWKIAKRTLRKKTKPNSTDNICHCEDKHTPTLDCSETEHISWQIFAPTVSDSPGITSPNYLLYWSLPLKLQFCAVLRKTFSSCMWVERARGTFKYPPLLLSRDYLLREACVLGKSFPFSLRTISKHKILHSTDPKDCHCLGTRWLRRHGWWVSSGVKGVHYHSGILMTSWQDKVSRKLLCWQQILAQVLFVNLYQKRQAKLLVVCVTAALSSLHSQSGQK